MKRFITWLITLIKRTLFGADGTTYHRTGLAGRIIDAAETAFGFIGLIVLPGIAGATLFHWLFD